MRQIRGQVVRASSAFTLIELLVVVVIISLLIATLLPSLRASREQARSAHCSANIRSLMTAMHQYAIDYRDYVVPSYNMSGVSIGVNNPLDGWGPILDKGTYVYGSEDLTGHAFVCPDTMSVAGMAGTQTGIELDNAAGFMDWPAVLTISQNYAATLPNRGFTKLIRVSYWINGDNPIGRPQAIRQKIHFTGSVGYGPDFSGQRLQNYRFDDFRWPGRVIAIADGIYSGNQESTREEQRDARVAYRHPGSASDTSNVGFADGHVQAIRGDRFPRKADGTTITHEMAIEENLGGGPTIYSDPAKFLLP